MSSSCGSSNVVEYLGYKFTNDKNALRKQIEEAKTLENENFEILESVMLESSLKREQVGHQEKKYTKCYSAEMRTLVTPSGCYVCPYFRGSDDKKIGDARYTPFKDIWLVERKTRCL